MKNLLLLLFTFNCAFIFSQTWTESTRIKVVKSGTLLTVKYTNDLNGVTTLKATCNTGKKENSWNQYKCTCASGDYFKLFVDINTSRLTIQYFNELNSIYTIKGKEFNFYISPEEK